MSALSAAARRGAVALLPGWRAFTWAGRDAVDLLSRLSTADLTPLAAGRAVTTLFLTPTGRVRHRMLLVPDSAGGGLALGEPGSESWPEWIDTYTFAEDCRIAPLGVHSVGAAFGSDGVAAAGELPARGSVARRHGVTWSRRDWGSLPVAIACGEAAAMDRALAESALPRLDAVALEQVRVEHGEPAMGAELTEERFPLEAGLLEEISFTKGCYTGQEVVARQDTYGKVARRLVGVAFAARPAPGDELSGEPRGCVVTSVAPGEALAPSGERCVAALAYVGTRSAGPATRVTTAAGLEGTVVALPFTPA